MPRASDNDREIHRLILAKDDLAFAKFCDSYYEPVYEKVRHFNRGIFLSDDSLVADVVTDVFMKYFNQPQRFDPGKQGLEKFLIMDAEGDLKNAWAKQKRFSKKEHLSVELEDENGNRLIDRADGGTPYEDLVNKEAVAMLDKMLNEVFEKEMDVNMAHLMLAGERRTIEYAKILRIDHLSVDYQQTEVKKQKDRIDKVIRRKLRSNN